MTGRTVEEAIQASLDQLGVAETDAEIVIVEEPKSAMFGLRKSGARIRARVRPVQPRAKRPSRRPKGSPGGDRGYRRQVGHAEAPARKTAEKDDANDGQGRPAGGVPSRTDRGAAHQGQGTAENGSRKSHARSARQAAESTSEDTDHGDAHSTSGRQRSRSRGRGGRGGMAGGSDGGTADESPSGTSHGTGSPKEAQMSIETQQELATDFVREVVARFGLEATTSARRSEDDGIYISVDGDNLGLLVGPKGATVEALQELTRTVVQRHTEEHTSRIVVDVGGYRERRAAALRQFVIEAAGDVLRTGVAEALEPMSPSDRKVVHDTINDIEGLETTSEGMEPRRYVIIRSSAAPSSQEAPSGDPEEVEEASEEPSDLS